MIHRFQVDFLFVYSNILKTRLEKLLRTKSNQKPILVKTGNATTHYLKKKNIYNTFECLKSLTKLF